MNKFSGAVRAGLNAADVAKLNRSKIREILGSLAEAVEAATDGKVTIRILTGGAAFAEDALKAFTSFMLAKKVFDALILEEKKEASKRKIQIARFQQSTSGFPCTVAVGSDEYICQDAESLENVLAKIMQTTAVGLSISELQSSVAPTVAQGRISKPTGHHDQRTIEGQVTLRSLPGKITDQPFDGKIIREVSGGTVNMKVNSSMRAIPTVTRARKTVSSTEPSSRATVKPVAKNISEKRVKDDLADRKISGVISARKVAVKSSGKPTLAKPKVKSGVKKPRV